MTILDDYFKADSDQAELVERALKTLDDVVDGSLELSVYRKVTRRPVTLNGIAKHMMKCEDGEIYDYRSVRFRSYKRQTELSDESHRYFFMVAPASKGESFPVMTRTVTKMVQYTLDGFVDIEGTESTDEKHNPIDTDHWCVWTHIEELLEGTTYRIDQAGKLAIDDLAVVKENIASTRALIAHSRPGWYRRNVFGTRGNFTTRSVLTATNA